MDALIVGLTVGVLVGFVVGVSVGVRVAVGVLVGLRVGVLVGFVVGVLDALIVGLAVGVSVGTCAAASMKEPSPRDKSRVTMSVTTSKYFFFIGCPFCAGIRTSRESRGFVGFRRLYLIWTFFF